MSATGAKRALADAGRGKRQAVEQDEFTKMPVASYAGLTDGDVREHLPLVRQVVQRMLARKPPEISTEDLLSWGMMGLLDAIQKYDASRDASFSTYAQYRIRGSILDYLRRCDWVPRSVRQRANDIESATSELEHRLGRRPRADEVADALGLSMKDYSDTLADCVSASLLSAAEIGHGRGEEALTLDDLFA
ncbi:sigma-70 family RNA polymerase sigma factor, partial [bacterium]|nr:sigma-70 family RNA polymerase sigma factor [bacterium]